LVLSSKSTGYFQNDCHLIARDLHAALQIWKVENKVSFSRSLKASYGHITNAIELLPLTQYRNEPVSGHTSHVGYLSFEYDLLRHRFAAVQTRFWTRRQVDLEDFVACFSSYSCGRSICDPLGCQ
jgi:hypothetical protein